MRDEIIKKVLDNCASEEDAAKVAEFLATDEGQKKLDALMDRELQMLENGEAALAKNFPGDEIYRELMAGIRRRRVRRTLWRAAAAVIPVAAAIAAVFYVNRNISGGLLFQKEEMACVNVPAGEKMKVVFHDGSTVVLNAGSTLEYPQKFGLRSRDVTLDGEGYFEIAKNPSRPFTIKFKDGDVKVYGTAFNLCAYGADRIVSLSLDNGSVAMDVCNGNYAVKPGEVLYFDRANDNVKITAGGTLFKSRWKDGITTFRGASLREIATTLSRRFAVDFKLSGDVDTTVLYTFTSSSSNLDEMLKELSIIAPVEISRDGSRVNLSRR